jgi:hypothetical protein
MASFTRDAADKAAWTQMAKRWLSCAEYYEGQQLALTAPDATECSAAAARFALLEMPTSNFETSGFPAGPASSRDYVVGDSQEFVWDSQAECFGGFEVDD